MRSVLNRALFFMPTSKYPEFLLDRPIAQDGDRNPLPVTAQEAGTGRLSQELGWGSVNALPINEGGVPPKREDFNSLAFSLSAYLIWIQQGGLFNYSPNYDYEVGNEVMYQGVKYRALQANGPSSALKTPGTDATVWKNMDANVPAGACLPFSNVTLGGSDGRRPIFWGKSQADEGWVLADGGSDGQGGNVPNLTGRFIKGSTVENAGQTGGSENQSISGNQIPAHTHTITINSAGGHTHTRGSMNITGSFGVDDSQFQIASGAFSYGSSSGNAGLGATQDQSGHTMTFNAANSWIGSTSNNGAHTHTATCSTTGSSSVSFSIQPPFYTMAFFVKLPE